MPTLPALDVASNVNYSPHVVILGAGASAAACPRGDKNASPLPVMATIIGTLALEPVLLKAGFHVDLTTNFEAIYDEMASASKYDDVCLEVEQIVRKYFSSLELPDHVTLYDQLLLSLRPKDIVATFNWDPFLLQAYARNRMMRNLPRVVFLHGNVYLGYCAEHRVKGYSTQNCSTCAMPLQPSPLLFPVRDKDYNAHPLLAGEWQELSALLEQAYMLTIFGYAAPQTDAAARELMLKAWNANDTRELAQIEVIDILPKPVIHKRWSVFIADLHGGATHSFRRTWQYHYPRRSCEALAFSTLQQDPWATRTIPSFRRLDRLQEWIAPLIEQERALDEHKTPLEPFRRLS